MPVYQDEDNAVAKAFSERPRTVQARKSIPFYSSLELAQVSEGPLENCGLGMFRSRTGSIWRMDEGKIWREDEDLSWVDEIVTAGDADRPSPPKKLLERYRRFKMAASNPVQGDRSCNKMAKTATLPYLSDSDTHAPLEGTPRAAGASSEVPSPTGADNVGTTRRGVFPGGSRKVGEINEEKQFYVKYMEEGSPRVEPIFAKDIEEARRLAKGLIGRDIRPDQVWEAQEKKAVTEKGDQVPTRQPYAEGDRVFSISRQIPGKVTKVVNQFVVEVKFEGPEGTFADETLVSDLQPDRTHFASRNTAGSTGTSTDGNHKTAPAVETDRNRVPLGSSRPKVG